MIAQQQFKGHLMASSYQMISNQLEATKAHSKRFYSTQLIPSIDKVQVSSVMDTAQIPSVSIARLCEDEIIANNITRQIPYTENPETTFGAASLSKTVFAYLVLTLLEERVLNVNSMLATLDTPITQLFPFDTFCQKHNIPTTKNQEWSNMMTIRMALSHTTGLRNATDSRIDFEPGTAYQYSGLALMYLQDAIEYRLGKDLEGLAKTYLFNDLGLTHTSFKGVDGKLKPNAANSLATTASEYLRLVQSWLKNQGKYCQEAFKPQISLSKDKWAKDLGVKSQTLNHLSWGLGFALECDKQGKAIKAFHTGDMNIWRAQVVVDLASKEAVTYFASGEKNDNANGHILSDCIIKPVIPLDYGFDWFYTKFGFARNTSGDWKADENQRMETISHYLNTGTLPKLPSLNQFVANHRFFKTIENDFIIENRHESPSLQQEYDKRFGLVRRN